MSEALASSGIYQQISAFKTAQSSVGTFRQQTDTFANSGFQERHFALPRSVGQTPTSFILPRLSGTQSLFASEVTIPQHKHEKNESSLSFEQSVTDLKNMLLLGEVKGLLSKGELIKARQLLQDASRAGQKFSEPILKLNHALTLEKVVTHAETFPHRKSEATWIKTNRASYHGKWVAVLGEQVVASGDTFKEVLAALKQKQLTVLPVIHHIE
ncbi:MAG: hypothetical protein A4E20_03970 [Nitrospira sp. SG-bin2]|jgi:hypothetical protein|uniref:DUF5678 domain-containing protein n=1 Tax=Nitrospira cf. moscoviensis SBR1015 TaxID=96242 RepID=UPI000A0B5B30|nr:DUF5678 domain-containing protein [Nitrospira cf. moscoviensis SBR1015]OQW31451.1 MAG: hypothetical protein A4E20_03970 [Nitrospira sp. SG-bin2]